jgi:hypothetical protein
MTTRITPLTLLLLAPLAASASQEQIHPWRRAAVTVETGFFGAVQVRWTADARKPRLASLTVGLGGKTLKVPDRALRALSGVDASSMAVHTERGYDKDPWLYVVFRMTPRGPKVKNRWAYFAIQGGKLKYVNVKIQTKDNQYRFEKLTY